jgi:CHRD domain-containing protein
MPVRARVLATILAALTLVAIVGAPTAAKRRRQPPRFTAFLSGFEEVPPVFTAAEGFFQGKLVKSGGTQTINYRLEYSHIENATAAHLHFGGFGMNGGVIAFLCGGGDKPACPPTGGTVTGTIDAADIVGPAAQGIGPGEIGDLITAMKYGVVYANIHTDNGDITPNTGPGDLSTGEVRGQVYSFFRIVARGHVGNSIRPIPSPGRPRYGPEAR